MRKNRLPWLPVVGIGLLILTVGCGHSNKKLMLQLTELKRELKSLRNSTDKRSDKLDEMSNKVLLLQDAVDSNRVVLYRKNSIPNLPVYKLNAPTKRRRGVLRVVKVKKKKFTITREPSVTQFHNMKFDRINPEGMLKGKLKVKIGKKRRGKLIVAKSKIPRLRIVRVKSNKPRLRVVRLKAPKRKLIRQVRVSPIPRGKKLLVSLKLYKVALAKYRARDMKQSLELFKRFAANYSRHPYSDNAFYWIGECYYHQGQLAAALAAFRTVVKRYPLGNKVPAAMLKIALTLKRQGKKGRAKTHLYKLIEVYPMSDAAKVAVSKMQEFSL